MWGRGIILGLWAMTSEICKWPITLHVLCHVFPKLQGKFLVAVCCDERWACGTTNGDIERSGFAFSIIGGRQERRGRQWERGEKEDFGGSDRWRLYAGLPHPIWGTVVRSECELAISLWFEFEFELELWLCVCVCVFLFSFFNSGSVFRANLLGSACASVAFLTQVE